MVLKYFLDGASGDPGESSESGDSSPKEMVELKVVYSRKKHDVTFPLDSTVLSFKQHLEKLTGKQRYNIDTTFSEDTFCYKSLFLNCIIHINRLTQP